MIARAISRADIPTFSAAEVEMGPENEQTYPAFGKFNLFVNVVQVSHTFYSV